MSAEHVNPTNPTSDARDASGRFKAGNRGGPGNPFARQVAALRQAMLNRVTAENIERLMDKLLELADQGSIQAIKLVLAYTIGKPQPAPNPDRMDADEWNVYTEQAPMKVEAAAVLHAGEPAAHLEMVRAVRPIISQVVQMQMAQEVSQMMTPPAEEEYDEEEPSTNGENGEAPPSPIGDNGEPLIARSFEELMASIANGKKSPPGPRTEVHEPSANGKKQRSAPKQARPEPSPNGKLPSDERFTYSE
jgi:hypothetical protein